MTLHPHLPLLETTDVLRSIATMQRRCAGVATAEACGRGFGFRWARVRYENYEGIRAVYVVWASVWMLEGGDAHATVGSACLN
jgi:hypothetical protein